MLRQVGRNQLVQHQRAGNHAVVHGGILAGKVKVIVQLLHQPHGGVIVDCAVGLAFLSAGIQRLQHGFRHTGQGDFFHL